MERPHVPEENCGTYESPPTPRPRRREIHRPARSRRAPRTNLFRPVSQWDRRARFAVPAALAVAALSAGLVSAAGTPADSVTSEAPLMATRAPEPATSQVPAAPAVVTAAQVALQRAERLTTDNRSVPAGQRKQIHARSAQLRALMAERAESALASRAGESA